MLFTPDQVAKRRGFILDERKSIDLNGSWFFQPDPDDLGEELGYHLPEYDIGGGWYNMPGPGCWREVTVPCTFDHCGQDMNRYEGIAWFRREFTVPADWSGNSALLRFEGLNHVSSVWLNGRLAGTSPDGHLRLDIDADHLLKFGDVNTLVVKVDNTGRPGDLSPGIRLAWFPEGGITRDVLLTSMSRLHIRDARFRYTEPSEGGGRFGLSVTVRNQDYEIPGGRIFVEITDLNDVMHGCYLAEMPGLRRGGESEIWIEDSAMDVKPWSPENPELYVAHIYLLTDVKRVDCVKVRFGFRKIEVQDGRLMLNGQPVLLTGFNRHEDSPVTGMAFHEETVREDLRKMKELGANFIRLCHYPHSPAELDICDEMGFLVLGEIPLIWWPGAESNDVNTAAEMDPDAFASKKEAAKRQLTKMIRRDMNHPSVIFWSVSNEVRTEYPEVLETNEELLKLAKSLDPSRLSLHVSCHWSEYFNRADRFDFDDVICMNQYPGMAGVPDPAQWWRDETSRLHDLYPDKPIMITEFGYNASSTGEGHRAEIYETEFSGMDAPYICGASIWGWADHPYPEDHMSGPGLRYGLCTRGRELHPAAETVRRMFTERRRKFADENGLTLDAPVKTGCIGQYTNPIRDKINLTGTWWCMPDPQGKSLPIEGQVAYPRTRKANPESPTGEDLGFYKPEFDVTGGDWGSWGRSRWRKVNVPCIYDDCGFDLRQYEGEVWFRRGFTVPESWAGRRIIIRFEGIHWRADIWVNGKFMVRHMDGLLRLDLDVSDYILFGTENTLVVKTDNTYRLGDRSPGILTGYFPDGGITREVELISMNKCHIDHARFLTAEPVEGGGRFHLDVGIANDGCEINDLLIRTEIIGCDGNVWWTGENRMGDAGSIGIDGFVEGIIPWSPNKPALYTARVSLENERKIIDREDYRFGFRKIEVQPDGIYLNGSQIFLYGTDMHEDSHRTGMAVDLETLRRDLLEMKRTGINFVRMAHAPRGPSALDVYDEVGVMVLEENNLHWWMRDWLAYTEVPMLNDGGPGQPNFESTVEAAGRQLKKMIERDMNHPCIIIWSVGNENFIDKPGTINAVREFVKYAKQLDPSRPVLHASHMYDRDEEDFTFDDIVGINGYAAEPSIWHLYMRQLREKYPDKPILITEFGYVGIIGEHQQAMRMERQFQDGMDESYVCGACVYSWVDVAAQGWDIPHPNIMSAYGISSRWREKREAVAVVRRMFANRREIRGDTL